MKERIRKYLLETENADVVAHEGFLRANSNAYEWLVEKTQAMALRNESEQLLDRVVSAAQFALKFHSGRFADGAIENLAFRIGAELDGKVANYGSFELPLVRKVFSRRILHVASHVLGVGGHTRMLCHWVGSDHSTCHSLVLVNQGTIPVPRWLLEALQISGGQLIVLPSEAPHCQKAKWLRETARRIADLVVLHHDPCDVVPTVAFAVNDCPPVAVLNHADHLFWIGSSVADMVISLRTAGAAHSLKRRFVSSNTVIPIPLEDTGGNISRKAAKRTLGIPESQIMLLSVGRGEKYRPCGNYDFVGTAGKILDRHPCAHFYVVGESLPGITPYLRCKVHDRLHFVGSIEDPSIYRSAADLYLESFPFGSQTALLEAGLSGLSVVPAYAPLFPLLVANDDAVLDLLPNPKNEQEYLDRVGLMIQQPDTRVDLGNKLRERLLADHLGNGWLDRLAALYRETDRLAHSPKPIPVAECCVTDGDISLSLWNVIADGKSSYKGNSKDPEETFLCHSAFVAKEVGDYATARRFAWQALLHDCFSWPKWRLLAITMSGRARELKRNFQ